MANDTLEFTNISAALPCEFNYPTPAAVIFMFIGLAIIIENVIGIVAIYSTPALRSIANIFVCSMAVTDISAGIASLLANMLIFASNFKSVPEHTATYGLMIMLIIFAMVMLSCAHMAIIAVERYVYIAHPFFYRKHISLKFITRTLTVFWACSTLYISALFIQYFTGTEVSTLCSRHMPDAPGLIFSFSVYFTSVAISCIVYCQITRIAIKQKRLHLSQKSSIRLDSVRGKMKPTKSVTQKEKMFLETLKSIKFFVIVFGMFLLFTLPPAVVFIIDGLFIELPNTAFRLSTAPAVLNSAVNFIVLTFLNKHFKDALHSLVCRKCRFLHRRC